MGIRSSSADSVASGFTTPSVIRAAHSAERSSADIRRLTFTGGALREVDRMDLGVAAVDIADRFGLVDDGRDQRGGLGKGGAFGHVDLHDGIPHLPFLDANHGGLRVRSVQRCTSIMRRFVQRPTSRNRLDRSYTSLVSARLSVVDEMFLRTHRGWGTPIVMQGLWRTDGWVDATTLDALTAELALGPLGRRVVRPRIPGARPRFEPSSDAFPVEYSDIAAGSVLAWADEQGSLPVDPERGPGWRLACARPAEGGTVLSLVCSHVIADARGLAAAIAAALQCRPPSDPGAAQARSRTCGTRPGSRAA